MIYIILIFISILTLEYIIPIHDNDSMITKKIKNLSIIFIILGIIGLYCEFKTSTMIYALFIIYTLAVFLNHPLQELFNNNFKNTTIIEKSLLPKKLSYYEYIREKENNLNSFYPDEILFPNKSNLKDFYNAQEDEQDLDEKDNHSKIYLVKNFKEGQKVKNPELEKLKEKLNNKFWDVSINNIYENKDDKSFIPIDKYQNMRPNNIKVDKKLEEKKKKYFPFLNILGNFKWIILIFFIFLLLLYVYDIRN